jgi:hypothetical protein
MGREEEEVRCLGRQVLVLAGEAKQTADRPERIGPTSGTEDETTGRLTTPRF